MVMVDDEQHRGNVRVPFIEKVLGGRHDFRPDIRLGEVEAMVEVVLADMEDVQSLNLPISFGDMVKKVALVFDDKLNVVSAQIVPEDVSKQFEQHVSSGEDWPTTKRNVFIEYMMQQDPSICRCEASVSVDS